MSKVEKNGDWDTPLYLDRDPEIFDLVLKYLRSERRFLPKNISYDFKQQLFLEIKYWGLDRGLAKVDSLTHAEEIQALESILSAVPKIDPKKQHVSLKNWKKFKPLSIEEILEKSD